MKYLTIRPTIKKKLVSYCLLIFIVYLYAMCQNAKDKDKTSKSTFLTEEKKISMDSLMQVFKANFGYQDADNVILRDSSATNYRIMIYCNNRTFFKVLHLANDSSIQETLFDVAHRSKNSCNIAYTKQKTIVVEQNEKMSFYYNKPKKYSYKDSIIYTFLNHKIDKFKEPIYLLDADGTFRVSKINHLGLIKEYDLYGHLIENQEVKKFYKALVKRNKKDNCECLENLRW